MQNVKAEKQEPVSFAGIRFGDKVDVYEYLQKHIKQDIIITGSTALKAYGLTNESDEFDLDLIVHKPTEETQKFFDFLSSFFPEHEHEKSYMKPDRSDFDIGKLSMFRLLGPGQQDFKVHIFYKDKAQQVTHYKFRDKTYPIALPGDIFLAKKRFARPKDYQQLGAICAKILKPE